MQTDDRVDGVSMRVVSRLSGVSPERIRAWESRYAAIQPRRTPGGTRRYSDADLERLTLLRRVVEAGHRISDVAQLDGEALRSRIGSDAAPGADDFLDGIDDMIDALDANALRARLESRCAEVGTLAFAREDAMHLAARLGDRWERGESSIAAEHAATAVLRSLLLDALLDVKVPAAAPRVVFATPSGERHDLGLISVAVVARCFGANSIFVGAEVPEPDLLECVRSARADALALGFVTSEPSAIDALLRRVRRALPGDVSIWIGGRGISGCAPVPGVDRIETMGRLEAFVAEAQRGAEVESAEGAR